MKISLSKPMWHRVPTWQMLWRISRSPLFASSISVMIAVPLLARINGLFGDGGSWHQLLLDMFDANPVLIPLNLLRIFWASFLFSSSHGIIAAFCPSIVRTYQNSEEWSKSSEDAIRIRAELEKEMGEVGEEKIARKLQARYAKEFNEAALRLVIVRMLLVLTYAIGAFLLLRVLWEQASVVISVTDIVLLIL